MRPMPVQDDVIQRLPELEAIVAMGQGGLTQVGSNEAMLQLGVLMTLGGQDGIDPAHAYPLFQPAMLIE